MRIGSAGISDKGKVRMDNQDSFFVDTELGLFMVADGMGGHKAGDVASQMAIETIFKAIKENPSRNLKKPHFFKSIFLSPPPSTGVMIREAIESANQEVYELSMRDEEKRGMGTTLVLVFLASQGYTVANVGDSRIYRVSSDSIKQITEDHSLVREQVDKGILTPEEARRSNLKNIITRAIGQKDTIESDIAYYPVREGDYLVLCSDGLTDLVEDHEIKEITVDESIMLEKRVEKMVCLSNERGGKDNITVIIVHLMQINDSKYQGFSILNPLARIMNFWYRIRSWKEYQRGMRKDTK